jgi:hypothetical protein
MKPVHLIIAGIFFMFVAATLVLISDNTTLRIINSWFFGFLGFLVWKNIKTLQMMKRHNGLMSRPATETKE